MSRSGGSTSGSSANNRWVFAAEGETDNSRSEIDRTSIQPVSRGIVRFWIRQSYDPPKTDDLGDTFDQALHQYEVDCTRGLLRWSAPYQYLAGKLIWSPKEMTMSTWRPKVPGSIGEAIVTVACQLAGIR